MKPCDLLRDQVEFEVEISCFVWYQKIERELDRLARHQSFRFIGWQRGRKEPRLG